jgi:hypothetical protein
MRAVASKGFVPFPASHDWLNAMGKTHDGAWLAGAVVEIFLAHMRTAERSQYGTLGLDDPGTPGATG